MKRLEMLALAGLGVVSSVEPARAQSGGPATIRFGVLPGEESALPYYAQEKGFLKQAGLDVQLTPFRDGGSATQALIAGAIDLGVTNSGSMSLAHSRGLPLYLIACGSTYSPGAPIAHLVVAKNSPVRSAKDLSGKTLAVSTLHDLMQAVVMAWIDKNGGDAKAVNFTEIPVVAQAPAVTQGRVDGASIVEPAYSGAKDDLQLIGLPYSACADGKPFQTLGFVGNKDWVDRNTALAKRCAAALHVAAQWANHNRDEAAGLLSAYTKMAPTVIAAFPRVAFAEANSPALVQPVIDLLTRYGFMPRAFQASELFLA